MYDADDPAEAIKHCCAALALQPGLHGAARLLASMLLIYAIDDEIEIAPRGLEAAMAYSDVSGQALSVAAIDWLKLQQPLAGALTLGRDRGWDAAAAMVLSKKGRHLIQDRLFLAALTKGVNTDIEVEVLLTALPVICCCRGRPSCSRSAEFTILSAS